MPTSVAIRLPDRHAHELNLPRPTFLPAGKLSPPRFLRRASRAHGCLARAARPTRHPGVDAGIRNPLSIAQVKGVLPSEMPIRETTARHLRYPRHKLRAFFDTAKAVCTFAGKAGHCRSTSRCRRPQADPQQPQNAPHPLELFRIRVTANLLRQLGPVAVVVLAQSPALLTGLLHKRYLAFFQQAGICRVGSRFRHHSRVDDDRQVR